MGKLKVLVAGRAGECWTIQFLLPVVTDRILTPYFTAIGKTSLIRSIVQSCEDIVHVDPLSPSQSLLQPPTRRPRSRRRQAELGTTMRLTEIHASTKPYPHWWTDTEETRVLRRRKSSADTVLERNVCFVDTPGYIEGNCEKDDMNLVVEYLESLLQQTASVTTMEEGKMVEVISGSGGILVDAVLYLLPPSTSCLQRDRAIFADKFEDQDITKDVDFMQRLSAFTNVIPIIGKSETLTPQELISLKTSILARLQATTIRPFLFGKPLDDALLAVQGLDIVYPLKTPTTAIYSGESKEPDQFPFPTPTHPYAVSSALESDNDTMDASLLMSPDYVQPLMPSELSNLIEQVFDPESIAWLRHAAAKKFLAWRRRTESPGNSFVLHGLQQPRSATTASVGLGGATMNRKLLHRISNFPTNSASFDNIIRLLRRLALRRPCAPFHLAVLLEHPVSPSLLHRRLSYRSYRFLPYTLHQQ